MSLFEIWKQPKTETNSEPPTVQEEVKRVLAQPQLTVQRQSEETVGSLADFEPQVIMPDIPVHKKYVNTRKRGGYTDSPLTKALKALRNAYYRGDVLVGDCFDIPHTVIRSVSGDTSFIYQIAKEAGVGVTVKKTANGDYRVWRLPEEKEDNLHHHQAILDTMAGR